MKSLIEYAITHKVVSYFVCILLLFGGIAGYLSLGQLEDPVFSIKTAVIVTKYPGASPQEVEQEVTDRIEKAIQRMPQLKNLYSISRAGESIITVNIKEQYWSDVLPQIWDDLRKKVHDVQPYLPPGVSTPMVGDDFGDVYGFLMALTGDGFSYRELQDYADILKKELSLVKGVSRVDLWGVQQRVVYVDVSEQQISQLNLTSETLLKTLMNQNMVVDAGAINVEADRYRLAPSGQFKTPEEIGELIIRPSSNDVLGNVIDAPGGANIDLTFSKSVEEAKENVIRVKDIANVYTGYQEPAVAVMRFDGRQAIGLQIAGTSDANIVAVGEALHKRLEQIVGVMPVGLELNKIAWQSDLVSESVNSFLISLVEAIVIVLIVLIIPSGLRMGFIVGLGLILTILGTFMVMAILQIPFQRMSLGALIIALGMMVDNSIVVSDGIAVRFRKGMDRKKAAIESAFSPAFPLLAATLIAIMAFYPIYASKESAGEYCRTLFIVVAAALTISWLIALLITPLQCMDILKVEARKAGDNSEGDEFKGPFFRIFRKVLKVAIRFRGITIGIILGMLAVSIFAFGFVSQLFFPDSSRPQMMIDYWAPAGTRIEELSKNIKPVEKQILLSPYVDSVSTFIGAGPPRFYLPVDPEKSFPNYAQMIVNVKEYENIDSLIKELEPWIIAQVPNTMVRFRKYSVGPGDTWKFAARFSGPSSASLETLRGIGNEVLDIVKKSPYGRDWRLDMQNRRLMIVPEYSQKRGRWSSISRVDLGDTLKRGYDGLATGLYREGEHLYPIIVRGTEEERRNIASNIGALQVKPELSTKSVPVLQVLNSIKPEWEDPQIIRWNRRRAVTVEGAPKDGFTFDQLQASVINEIDALKLPVGYELFWDGEADSSASAKQSLIPGVIPAVVIILLMLVMVFNDFRPVAIILLTIPFALIGVVWSLLIFNVPFGFLALLGSMSLAGMMNKNIVVLLDACNENLLEGMSPYDAIVEAAITRLRPVLLAAGTTVLGVVPLLPDVFWVGMAVTIMGGLTFGSILTLIIVPVLYSIFYKIKVSENEESAHVS